MSTSFYTGTEAALYTGSRAFSEKISATPEVFGLTADMAAEYAALDAEWGEAYLAAASPETRTRGRVRQKNDLEAVVRKAASRLAKIIQGQPTVSDEQRANLGLSVRKTPSPIPPPGLPTQFTATPFGNGWLLLKWKCRNPRRARGTMYYVYRSIDGGDRKYLGLAQVKKFVDETIPVGSKRITYHIQGVRSKCTGPWGQFVVAFGGGIAAVKNEPPVMKIAE